MKMRKITALLCAVTMTLGLVACGSGTETELAAQATETEASDADLTGTVSMAGSTSMEKLANATAESFMAKYPGVTVTAEFTGSSAGVEAVTAGSVDIGNESS